MLLAPGKVPVCTQTTGCGISFFGALVTQKGSHELKPLEIICRAIVVEISRNICLETGKAYKSSIQYVITEP